MPDSIKGNTCDYIDKLHWAHLMTDPVVGYVIEAEMETSYNLTTNRCKFIVWAQFMFESTEKIMRRYWESTEKVMRY